MRTLILVLLFVSQALSAQYDAALKAYIPPTPVAASFGKYAEQQVGYFSGTTSITIPIETLRDNLLSHTVALTYHTAGVKAAEVASSVGLGWNLQAGGVITRSVRGLIDEGNQQGQLSGYYSHGFDDAWLTNTVEYDRIIEGKRDAESDLYFFNFEGFTGSFVFDRNGNVVQYSKTDVKIIPITTSYNYNKFLWKAIAPDGTIYYFGDVETNDGIDDDAVSYNNTFAQQYNMVGSPDRFEPIVDAWHLVKVETHDKSSSITFEYDKKEAYAYRNLGTFLRAAIDVDGRNVFISGNANDQNPLQCTEALIPRLSRIITDDRILEMVYSLSDRKDVDHASLSIHHPKDFLSIPPSQISTARSLNTIILKNGAGVYLNEWQLHNSYFTSPINGFTETLGLSMQTDAYGSYYSDMRRLRLDSVARYVGSVRHYSQAINYHESVIQRRVTFAQDDHSYANGKTANTTLLPNIILDTLASSVPEVDLTVAPVLGDRSVDHSEAIKPMIKDITLPLGGKRILAFEPHSHYINKVIESGVNILMMKRDNCANPFPPSNCTTCCANDTVLSPIVTIVPNSTTRYEMDLVLQKTPNDASTTGINVQIQYKTIGSPWLIMDDLFLSTQNNFKILKCYSQFNLPFAPIGQIEFRIVATTGRKLFVNFSVNRYTRSNQMTNVPISGFRIKSITDQPVIGPDIVKTVTYDGSGEASGQSTGYLIGLPTYLQRLPADANYFLGFENTGGVNTAPICYPIRYLFNSGNTYPLAQAAGAYIGYRRVTESTATGHGHTEHRFYDDPNHTARYLRTYPQLPEYYINKLTGMEYRTASVNSMGDTLALQNRSYSVYNFAEPATSYASGIYLGCDASSVYTSSIIIGYQVPTTFVYESSKTSRLDNVVTHTTMEHGGLPLHTQVTATEVTNSDGKVHRTEQYYTHDYTPDLAIKSALLAQNRLLPAWQSISKVNGIILDGSRSIYGYYSTVNGDATTVAANSRIYPKQALRQEITWTNGSYINNGWQAQSLVKNYQMDVGKPYTLSIDGWVLDHNLTWYPNGNLSSRTYGIFTSTYFYDAQHKLLSSMINPDGRSVQYTYDGLLRLSTTADSPNQSTTSHDYSFGGLHLGNTQLPFVKTTNTFLPTAGSDLVSTTQYGYLDGLGRDLQAVAKDGGQTVGIDVVLTKQYDALGRPTHSYNPQAAAGNNCAYVAATPTEPAGITTYYTDQLNRPLTTTPPQWYASQQVFGTNLAPLGGFPAHSLVATSVIDPDTKTMTSYTDKIGNKVLDIRGQQSIADQTTTTYLYDDKNRLIKVIPPGATASDVNLIFENKYSGNDLLLYKKVPDAAAEEYVYNNRDLLIGRRNGILQAQGRWLVTHYDDYGRPIRMGYHNLAGTLPSNDNPTIHTLMSENFYDGFNGSSTNADPIYKGQLRKKRTKVLEDGSPNAAWIETEYNYDIYGRISHTIGINHLGDPETMAYTFDFANNVMTEQHTISGSHPISEVKRSTYDHQGRNLKEFININATGEKELSNKTYNHRNEVIQNQLGYTTTTFSYLQDIDYTYNAQGWLTSINELFNGLLPSSPNPCGTGDEVLLRSASTTIKDLFAQNLSYEHQANYAGISPSHNGNISTQYWWHRGQYNQSYSYQYDFLDRVKKSLHGQTSVVSSKLLNAYNEDFDYDVRGNITKLNRKGMMHMNYIDPECMQAMTIDSLSYNYDLGSNKLMQVSDKVPCQDILQLPPHIERDITYAANQKIMVDHTKADCTADILLKVGYNLEILDSLIIPASCQGPATITVQQVPCDDVKFSEGFSQQSNGNYHYDTSGNMTYDPHKKLTFFYNFLNLPYKIIGAENDTMFILYGSDAGLLQRKYVKGNKVQYIRDYLGDKEWRNDTLEIIHHNNGRILNIANNFVFEYFLKDHLNNVRTTFVDTDGDGSIEGNEELSRNDYYAFGMRHESMFKNLSPIKNRQTYLGKEYMEDMSMNLFTLGLRIMNPEIGRFNSVDLLSDYSPGWNGYRYGFNNPMIYSDPAGLFETKKDAQDYAKRNKIGVGFLHESKVVKNSDGTYSINNKSAGTSIFQDRSLITESNTTGIYTSALIGGDNPSQVEPQYGSFMGIEGQVNAPPNAGVAFASAGAEFSAKGIAYMASMPAWATKSAVDIGVLHLGRLGNANTRKQIADIATELKQRGYSIIGGGQQRAEEYLKPLFQGRKGGSYPDITASHPSFPTLRINTVDVYKSGLPTIRELNNAARIRSQIANGEHLLLIPKI